MSAPILSLPTELVSLILSSCDYATVLALCMTCKQLHELATHRQYGMADLLQIEHWPCYDLAGQAEDHMKQPLAGWDYFACSLCLRIRSAARFSNAMMRGKRGKHSPAISGDLNDRLNRFCIDCGVQHGRYQGGVVLSFGGAWITGLDGEVCGGEGLVCRRCQSFSRLSRDEERRTRTCTSCSFTFENRRAGLVQTASTSEW